MSNSTIIWIGLTMVFFTFLGMIIGYTIGHEEGRAEGFDIGVKHGKR